MGYTGICLRFQVTQRKPKGPLAELKTLKTYSSKRALKKKGRLTVSSVGVGSITVTAVSSCEKKRAQGQHTPPQRNPTSNTALHASYSA